jgi:hypothetical protein
VNLTNIDLAGLGTVPSATNATTANTATTACTVSGLTSPEAIILVNASNQRPIEVGSTNLTSPLVSGLPPAGFYKATTGSFISKGQFSWVKKKPFLTSSQFSPFSPDFGLLMA